jgi:hypothetical protein
MDARAKIATWVDTKYLKKKIIMQRNAAAWWLAFGVLLAIAGCAARHAWRPFPHLQGQAPTCLFLPRAIVPLRPI